MQRTPYKKKEGRIERFTRTIKKVTGLVCALFDLAKATQKLLFRIVLIILFALSIYEIAVGKAFESSESLKKVTEFLTREFMRKNILEKE